LATGSQRVGIWLDTLRNVGERIDGRLPVLDGASLVGASLVGARLDGARLDGARLDGARLDGASLVGASLVGASLVGARLDYFKNDLIAEVLKRPNELENLRDTLIAGKIDGSTYTGECVCLAGTIANRRGIEHMASGCKIENNGVTFVADYSSPREQWFMTIRNGDTPESSLSAKVALEWINEAIAIRDSIRKMAA